MNIIAIRLVLVGTKSGLDVMCKILTVASRPFFYLCMHVNSTFLGRDLLPLVLILVTKSFYIKLRPTINLLAITCSSRDAMHLNAS